MHDGTGKKPKCSGLHVIEVKSRDVGGKGIRGELDTAYGECQRIGQSTDKRRLADSRDVLDQDVAAGEETDKDCIDGLVRAEDPLGDIIVKAFHWRFVHGIALRIDLSIVRNDSICLL